MQNNYDNWNVLLHYVFYFGDINMLKEKNGEERWHLVILCVCVDMLMKYISHWVHYMNNEIIIHPI